MGQPLEGGRERERETDRKTDRAEMVGGGGGERDCERE